MAYVMNPYSYKLGYSLSWSDDWFSNKKLYPVMLQIMLTIRYFLLFFWTSRNIEKLDTYLSHLNLTLNSGRLLITLFFYEAKMNQPEKNKYKTLKSVIHSIPYSKSSSEFIVPFKINGKGINKRLKNVSSDALVYFNKLHHPKETIESQRFFLFFHFLGLDPSSFLLEFYLRYTKSKLWQCGLSDSKFVKNYVQRRRNKKISGYKQPRFFIHHLEFLFLNRIYDFLNKNVFFFWLYDKDKNLNMVRFLRSLFFYGGMAHFGRKYAPLMKSPGKTNTHSNFPIVKNLKKINTINKKINFVKKNKLKKNNNIFLCKLRIFNYFSLLNLNYSKMLDKFKLRNKKYDLSNVLDYTLKQLRKQNQKKKRHLLFFNVKKKLKKNNGLITKKNWINMHRVLRKKERVVNSFRKKKIKLIEKFYSPYTSYTYIYSNVGNTNLDSWGNLFLDNGLRNYDFIINSYGFSKNRWGKRLKISTLTRYNYYRPFFNYYGNYVWKLKGNELNYYINIPKNILRYVFFNNFYKNSYDNFLNKKISDFLNYDKYDILTNTFYLYNHGLSLYFEYKKSYNKAMVNFLQMKSSVKHFLHKRFWDFRKIYPKLLENVTNLIDDPNYEGTLNLPYFNFLVRFETESWNKYDLYNSVFHKFLMARYLLVKYEIILNKYLKYKNFFYNYKRGVLMKNFLFQDKKKKNILLWKTKFWLKFKTYNDFKLKKNIYLVNHNYFNHFRKKKTSTFLFLYNTGIFNNLSSKNSVLVTTGSYDTLNKDKIYIKKNDEKFKDKKSILLKNQNFDFLKKNYIYVDNFKKDFKNSIIFAKNYEKNKNKIINRNKKIFESYLKNKKFKNLKFLKENYKNFFKKKKKTSLTYKTKLLLLDKHIKFLKSLDEKKRLNLIFTFLNKWLKSLKKKKKKVPYDRFVWFYFIFKARPKDFKWTKFKMFLREKEDVDWKKLYIFLRYHTISAAFDWTGLKQKIKNQGYSKEKTIRLLEKFGKLLSKRRGDLKRLGNYPRYGLKLFKYFSKWNQTTIFKKKLYGWYQRSVMHLHMVRLSYARLFFIFWFISLRNTRNIEPKQMYLNKHYGKENLYEFGSLLFLYIVKKPFYDFFSYYIRSILKYWLGINVDFNYIMITNDELSAQFIANHIARGLHFGYKWREIVKPIRKDLKQLLTNLRVLENRSRNKYFTKYEKYEKYENTMYEYSNIYIKLHIKNYLISFKYSLKLKKVYKYIKSFYWGKIFVNSQFSNKKISGIIGVIDDTKDLKDEKISIWPFFVFLNYFFKLKYYYFFFVMKLKKNFYYLKLNFLNIFNKCKINKLKHHWNFSNIDYYNFFFKNRYRILSKFDFKFLKKNFIINKYNNFFLKNKLYKKNWFLWKHNKEIVYKYFLCKDKRVVIKSIGDLKFLKFGSWLAAAEFCKIFYKSKLYKDLMDKIYLKINYDYELLWFKVWISFMKTPVLAFYFRFRHMIEFYNVFKSLKSRKIKVRYSLRKYLNLVKNLFIEWTDIFFNYLDMYDKILEFNQILNSNKFFSKISYKKKKKSIFHVLKFKILKYFKSHNFLLIKFNNYLLCMRIINMNNFSRYQAEIDKIIEETSTYNYISFDKPKGWLYSFFFYFFKRLKSSYNFINSNKEIYIFYIKNIFFYYLYYFYFLFNYFWNKNLLKLLNKIYDYLFLNNNYKIVYVKINYFKSIDFLNKLNKNFFKNFYYLKFNILLNYILNKSFFFYQFKFIYNKSYILNNINNYISIPILKISFLLNLKKFDWNLLKIVDRGSIFNKNYLSKYSSVIKKKTFVDYFYQNRFLLGYKIRFAGRFKRKRKRSIMWLKRGLTPITAHDKWIDYGDYEIAGEFSQFSVRIWLNKNQNVKYKHYLKF